MLDQIRVQQRVLTPATQCQPKDYRSECELTSANKPNCEDLWSGLATSTGIWTGNKENGESLPNTPARDYSSSPSACHEPENVRGSTPGQTSGMIVPQATPSEAHGAIAMMHRFSPAE